jgi:ketol-acid reductoisomerase
MRARISETAKWGDLTVGPKIIDAGVKARMKDALEKIQSGEFARGWVRETRAGKKRYQQLLDQGKKAPIEKVGERLRRLMPWLEENS